MAGYSKGGTIHKTKATTNKIVKSCRETGIPCRVIKLRTGYRVDKKY